jgi:hypothetical protein
MKVLKEPLLHFLVIGVLLFALFAFVGGREQEAVDEIVITPGRIQNLVNAFSRTMQRPPTASELNGLVEEFIREEIYYREALALGLERDDMIVRRRMRQKLEFLSEDIADLQIPSEAELQQYLEVHADYFRMEPVLSFRHVFLNPELRGDRMETATADLLRGLREGTLTADSDTGDRFMLGYVFEESARSEIAETFGDTFTAELLELPTKQWNGPLASAYGLHLVKVEAHQQGRLPELAEVRDAVLREWTSDKRTEMNQAVYEEFRNRYKVTVEWEEFVSSVEGKPSES